MDLATMSSRDKEGSVRIQPRRQILDIWQSVTRHSIRDGVWVWGGQAGSNSISDAEQLLCLLHPADKLPMLSLSPERITSDTVSALKHLGEPSSIPRVMVGVLDDYLARYTDDDQEPIFAAGGYLSSDDTDTADPGPITEQQRKLGVVDSYAVSVRLCLAGLAFLRENGEVAGTAELVDRVELRLQDRLTCAMVGLLRSFAVRTVPNTDRMHRAMVEQSNQEGLPPGNVLALLEDRLSPIRNDLRAILTSIDIDQMEPTGDSRLFECGWSWGVARTATPVGVMLDGIYRTRQPQIAALTGIADPLPNLYSTVAALTSVDDLRSERTRLLGLLTPEQLRLTSALQVRAEVTQRYWAALAEFGNGRWPLEDLPWRTADGAESDYYSLMVSALLVQDFQIRGTAGDELARTAGVLDELATRGRVVGGMDWGEATVAEPARGVRLRLHGSEAIGPPLYRHVTDFAPLLFTCAMRSAGLAIAPTSREHLVTLSEEVTSHLWRRRIRQGSAAGLWDDPGAAALPYGDDASTEAPSWYYTNRIVEALVTAAQTYDLPALRSDRLTSLTYDLIDEAEHLFNQVGVALDPHRNSALTGIRAQLDSVQGLLAERPVSAASVAVEALAKLEEVNSTASPGGRSLVQTYIPRGGATGTDEIVPVSIYLGSGANPGAAEEAVLAILHAFGFTLDEAKAPVSGSWFRAMTARLRSRLGTGDVLGRLERALEIQALHRPQAEIDAAQGKVVAELITALAHDQNAFIQIGSVFLIKVDGVTVVRNLTQQELVFLQRRSGILDSPRKILDALEEFANGGSPLQLTDCAADIDARQIVIERHPVRVGVCHPDQHGQVAVTLDNGCGQISSYDVNFNIQNGHRPGPIRPSAAVHVQASPDGTALLHHSEPTLTVKKLPTFPQQLEMTLDCGDGPVTYTLEFTTSA